MNYILGIDIGTSNTKAIGYAADGSIMAHASLGYSFSSVKEGEHEIDPKVLFDAVIAVIADAVRQASGHTLQAVSFSAAMHGLFAVDDRCRPLTNMITWADLRSSPYAIRLRHTELGQRLYQRTGTPIHPMSPLCKLMWMKDNIAVIFNAAYKFISIKEYVCYQLFGEYVIDRSIASATGLFDIYDRDWNAEALQTAGITAGRLSKHVSPDYILKGIKNGFAGKMGIDPQVPFVAGASDGCLAHLGSNALHTNEVSLTIGTSGAVRRMIPAPVFDAQQRIFNYLLTDERYIAGGALNNGGNVLQWFNSHLAGRSGNTANDYDWFMAEAVKIPAGSDGLIFLPYIYGERAPVWDPEARGVFYGVSGMHTQAHFMRAILEGTSFALQSVLETLEEVLGPSGSIYVSGGFTHSPDWVALLADVLGRPLLVTGTEDASSAGAAIMAMQAIGVIPSLDRAGAFFTVRESFGPRQNAHQAYRDNYTVYAQLYDRLKDLKR